MIMNLIIIVGVVFAVLLLILLFVVPTDIEKRKKKKRLKEEPVIDVEKLMGQIGRAQKENQRLEEEIRNWEKKEKDLQKKLLIEEEKGKRFQEKLAQERGFQEKEMKDIEKKSAQINELKAEMKKLQETYSDEHSRNIRFERELQENKALITQLQDTKRGLELQITNLNVQNNEKLQEIWKLKREAADLAKKQADTQWISKAEYDQLDKKYQEKDKDFQRIMRQIEKEKNR